MKRHLPNVVTLAGGVLAIAGMALGSATLLIAGVLCDLVDGELARWLQVDSEKGAKLDWTVDVLVAGALAAALGSWLLLALELVVVAAAVQLGRRISGRALMTAIAVAVILLAPQATPLG